MRTFTIIHRRNLSLSSATKGKPLPIGVKEKISIALHKYYQKHPAIKGMLGKTHTKAWRERHSLILLNSYNQHPEIKRLGNKNGRWLGGTSLEIYDSKFNKSLKNKIRSRDNYVCQIPACSTPENGKQHDVHHIDYDKKNCHQDNLITLCHNCHMQTNSHRAYWIEYFQWLRGELTCVR